MNLVLIVLDTTRPDYLSVYGYRSRTTPYLEEFASQGVRFDRAYSVSSWTLPAHASLLTGVLPDVHGATQRHPKLDGQFPVLAERLSQAGYQTAGFSNNPWVSKRTGLGRGFSHFEGVWIFGEDTPTVAAVRKWITESLDKSRPFFLFVNLAEPHRYRPPWDTAAPFIPSKQEWQQALQRFEPSGGGTRVRAMIRRHYSGDRPFLKNDWRAMRALYEGELLLVDRITRQLIELVDAVSAPEDTIVLIVSDHGENLGDHGHVNHLFNLYDSNLRVVFLARGPGFAANAVDRRLVQLTDAYATLLRAAGLEPEANCAGMDLRGKISEDRLLTALLEYPLVSLKLFPKGIRGSNILEPHKRVLRAAISTRYKVIRGSDGSQEVFDLLEDPDETRPLELDDLEPAFRTTLRGSLPSPEPPQPADQAESNWPWIDERARKALRALGYLE